MPQLSDSERARRRGHRSGYDPLAQAGNCPYPHSEFHLRRDWFSGFAAGRTERRHDAGVWPARVDHPVVERQSRLAI